MRGWLTTPGSLTARLIAHSRQFRVQKLRQAPNLCLADEAAVIGLARARRVWEREVLLRCDGAPVVYGHTVVPMSATAQDWPLFSALGERSLGTTLFYDPRVARGQLEFARIRPGHPLLARMRRSAGRAWACHPIPSTMRGAASIAAVKACCWSPRYSCRRC
jgi:chorismate--pyruvate lyase